MKSVQSDVDAAARQKNLTRFSSLAVHPGSHELLHKMGAKPPPLPVLRVLRFLDKSPGQVTSG